MLDAMKRKVDPEGDGGNRRYGKSSKGSNCGKWQTPHQKAKAMASHSGGQIEPGDRGIWATCARGMEGKASGELKDFFEECAENFYDVNETNFKKLDEENGLVDIETSIQMEITSLKSTTTPRLFQPVHLDLQCVLFFKTCSNIDPVDFVDRICKWIKSSPGKKMTKYINRLTPMTLMGKATEKGLIDLTFQVLSQHFKMNKVSSEESSDVQGVVRKTKKLSYAIRPTIRNHNTLKSDALIKQIATSISDLHRVDLTNPDRVIIVEVYQNICGMSVVDGKDWERLKRYNLAELYSEKIIQQPVEPALRQEPTA